MAQSDFKQSARNSKRNKLGKKSEYIKQNEWIQHFNAVYPDAIFQAADEAFGGIEIKELKSLVD